MGNLITAIEIVVGILGIFSLGQIKQRLGDRAAVASGVASGLLIFDGMLRGLRDSRYARAWSLLVASATCIFVFSILFPPVSSFFGKHPNLQWATPPLLAFGLVSLSPWRIFGFLIWLAIPLLWFQEIALDGDVQQILRNQIHAQDTSQNGACGRDPHGTHKCCKNGSLFFIEYEGPISPYVFSMVPYRERCLPLEYDAN